MTGGPIRVLVVDDSAFARKVVRQILEAQSGIEVVAIARDGLDALEKIAELRPDVVTLDLLMPNLDGLGVLDAIDAPVRARCIIVSTAAQESDLVVSALQAGAFDVVRKPTSLATDRLYEIAADLVTKVRTAAGLRERPREPLARATTRAAPAGRPTVRLVVIGASTGGPQALTHLLPRFAADFPVPIAIVLHMPPGYTAALAERLDGGSSVDVVEASDGLVLRAGLVVLARAGLHMRVARDANGEGHVSLGADPASAQHRPSVDVLFESAAKAFGANVLAVVMTGMGDDGLAGARAVCGSGGRVLTESESSCVVYGMPRAVVEAGLSHRNASLEGMATLIEEAI